MITKIFRYRFKPRDLAFFDYPKEFTTLPAYTAEAKGYVIVLRPLVDGVDYDYEGEPMYLVQNPYTGWEGDAFESELWAAGWV